MVCGIALLNEAFKLAPHLDPTDCVPHRTGRGRKGAKSYKVELNPLPGVKKRKCLGKDCERYFLPFAYKLSGVFVCF